MKDYYSILGVTQEADLDLIKATLGNEDFEAGENIVSLNSAAVIYVSGIGRNFESAFEIAIDAIKSGKALKKLSELASFSNTFNESSE